MTRAHATGWSSGSPTSAQLKEFFAQIESGNISKPRLQAFLRNEPIPETVLITGGTKIFVRRNRNVLELAEIAKFEVNDPCVRNENFPIMSGGMLDSGYRSVVHFAFFGRCIGTKEALLEFDRLGFRAANPRELLEWRMQNRDRDPKYERLVALGQLYNSDGEGDLAISIAQEPKITTPNMPMAPMEWHVWASPEYVWSDNEPDVWFAICKK